MQEVRMRRIIIGTLVCLAGLFVLLHPWDVRQKGACAPVIRIYIPTFCHLLSLRTPEVCERFEIPLIEIPAPWLVPQGCE